jgi:phage FluMu protein gp41
MQLKDGLKMGNVTYLVALREVKEKDIVDVPRKVVELLEENSSSQA